MTLARRLREYVGSKLRTDGNSNDSSFLSRCCGVIHVGANIGQERDEYESNNLKVVWIEPLPSVFEQLQQRLSDFPGQTALCALVTDVDDREYQFNVANNNGESSSILAFSRHTEIWPEVEFVETVTLNSRTLDSLFTAHEITLEEYDVLVIDTQGSELLVLKGAQTVLHNFAFVKVEVADFESYEGCCQLRELTEFLQQHGFLESHRTSFAATSDGQNYFDVLFERVTG